MLKNPACCTHICHIFLITYVHMYKDDMRARADLCNVACIQAHSHFVQLLNFELCDQGMNSASLSLNAFSFIFIYLQMQCGRRL